MRGFLIRQGYFMKNIYISLLIFLSFTSNANGQQEIDFRQLQLDKPIWAVHLESADWLISKKGNTNTIGFLSY